MGSPRSSHPHFSLSLPTGHPDAALGPPPAPAPPALYVSTLHTCLSPSSSASPRRPPLPAAIGATGDGWGGGECRAVPPDQRPHAPYGLTHGVCARQLGQPCPGNQAIRLTAPAFTPIFQAVSPQFINEDVNPLSLRISTVFKLELQLQISLYIFSPHLLGSEYSPILSTSIQEPFQVFLFYKKD